MTRGGTLGSPIGMTGAIVGSFGRLAFAVTAFLPCTVLHGHNVPISFGRKLSRAHAATMCSASDVVP
jgi:hypothetical protein